MTTNLYNLKNKKMENKTFANEKCPEHNETGKFMPPTSVDMKRKKIIVTFECPKGQFFTKEFGSK